VSRAVNRLMRSLSRLLPFERITVESRRSPEDLVAMLAQVTRPEPTLEIRLIRPKEAATFVGEVSSAALSLRRATGHRNSFAPLVVGKIVKASSGARIEGVLRLHIAVLVFLAVWVSLVTPYALVSIGQLLRDGTLSGLSWLPLAMLAGMYAMCMLGYAMEAAKTKELLRELANPAPAARSESRRGNDNAAASSGPAR
jgi:hypothetical protein